MNKKKECPYCLSDIGNDPVCNTCKQYVSTKFTEKHAVSVGLVGLSGHGKTVYVTSFFSELYRMPTWWAGFYFRSFDTHTHNLVYRLAPNYMRGVLPESTPVAIQSPGLLGCYNIPEHGDAHLRMYDAAGETYSDPDLTVKYAKPVCEADAVMLVLSLSDSKDPSDFVRLLDNYVQARDRLRTQGRQKQNAVIVLSKADKLVDRMPESVRNWYEAGEPSWYAVDMDTKLHDMSVASMEIEEWLAGESEFKVFANLLRNAFGDTKYSLVSSNIVSEGGRQRVRSLRVLDPFWWLMYFYRAGSSAAAVSAKGKKRRGWLARLFSGDN